MTTTATITGTATSAVARLLDLGQSPWYDNLTRPLARGGLSAMIERDGFRGVTSNPTIFEKAITAGSGTSGASDYDEALADLRRAGASTVDAYWALVTDDIGRAADQLGPVHDATGGADGYVSVEVDPELARDTAGTLAQASALFARLDRPNTMIKIPATVEGLPAVEEAIAAGVNVNCTLIFSLERYGEVIEAYLRGLERRVAADADLSAVASVASFFVSRVDSETDRRLPAGHPLRGRAAVANARLAYRLFRERFAGDRWAALAARGARLQRPLWASTSTKNPEYSPTLYVDELIGPDTVNTLAQASVDALREPGAAERLEPGTVEDDPEGAEAVLDGLAQEGVDFADVTGTLEREGVAAFAASFRSALTTLEARLV